MVKIYIFLVNMPDITGILTFYLFLFAIILQLFCFVKAAVKRPVKNTNRQNAQNTGFLMEYKIIHLYKLTIL